VAWAEPGGDQTNVFVTIRVYNDHDPLDNVEFKRSKSSFIRVRGHQRGRRASAYSIGSWLRFAVQLMLFPQGLDTK